MGIPNAAEIMRLKARGRTEADMIATALQDAPPLDREGMGAELYPFNEIASAESVQAAVEKIVRRRMPDNPWNDVHTPLCKTDQSGNGYWSWVDTFRDVAFLVGVDYALGSLPSWWPLVDAMGAEDRAVLGKLVESLASAGKDGAR